MKKARKGIWAAALALCLLVLLAVPTSAANSDSYGLTMAMALDKEGNVIAAEYAIVTNFSNGTFVDAPASLVSEKAASEG